MVGVIGGELRQKYALEKVKMPVLVYGNDSVQENDKVKMAPNLGMVMEQCSILIVPIPFSKDNKEIFAKYSKEPIWIDRFISQLNKDHILIGGPFSKTITEKIKEKGSKILDITELETFKLKNAIPTVEGVISELISKTDRTIHGSKSLVLGYGYCGKRMANILCTLGAMVDIYTENDNEKNSAMIRGNNLITKLNYLDEYDYIINTIPKVILDMNKIKQLVIDITEANYIETPNLIKMRGIPGNYSPKTAGYIIGEILNELIISITGENS